MTTAMDSQSVSTQTLIKHVPLSQRELWRGPECAALLGISKSVWLEMNRHEQTPESIHLNRGVVAWRAREIRDWVNAGCPDREHWFWRPVMPQKLDDLLKQKHRELRAINDDIRDKLQELSELSQQNQEAVACGAA